MKRLVLSLVVVAFLAGCVEFTPDPIAWEEESSVWTNGTQQITGSSTSMSLRVVAFNATLNALRRARATSEAKAVASGWWEDPTLDMDALRILRAPEHAFMGGASLSFTLPLTGIPALEEKAAAAYAAVDRWEIIVAERETVAEVLATVDALREQKRLEARLDAALADPDYRAALDVVHRLVEAGEVTRAEARALDGTARELAMTRQEIHRTWCAAETQVRTLAAVPPQTEIVWDLEEPFPCLPTNRYVVTDFTNAPSVRAALARLEGKNFDLRKEIARQYPELSLGPSYTHEDGFNRIGLTASLTLPLWNRNRVGIAGATGERAEARGAAVEAWRKVVSDWAALHREYAATTEGTVPISSQDEETLRRLYAAGELTAVEYVADWQARLSTAVAETTVRIEQAKLIRRMWGIHEGIQEGLRR